jgi:signal peptidase II
MGKRSRILLLLILLAMTVGCDRVTKHLATRSLAGAWPQSYLGGLVRLEYAENTGGFLSMGSTLSPIARFAIFIVGTGFLLVALAVILFMCRGSDLQLAGMTLLLAGGASNLMDRLAHGAVVDFATVGVGSVRTGVFNVADVAVLGGILMLLLFSPAPGALRHRA